MRRFSILLGQLPLSKSSVRQGLNAKEVVIVCRCVNVGLFLSHGLRKDVEVQIAYGDSDNLIAFTFPGRNLKRVSPDERSVSFFLLKAQKHVENIDVGETIVMDNGIVVSRTKFSDIVAGWKEVYFAAKEVQSFVLKNKKPVKKLFIYDATKAYNFEKFSGIYAFSSPERFLLEVNRHFDKNIGY